MKLPLPIGIKLYGSPDFRGDCPLENAELITFIYHIKAHYSNMPALHIKNEGKRTYRQSVFEKTIGALHKGACDIMIPGSPALCLELKRKDHTKSTIDDDQITFLLNSSKLGAYSCVALGHEAAIEAFLYWKKIYD